MGTILAQPQHASNMLLVKRMLPDAAHCQAGLSCRTLESFQVHCACRGVVGHWTYAAANLACVDRFLNLCNTAAGPGSKSLSQHHHAVRNYTNCCCTMSCCAVLCYAMPRVALQVTVDGPGSLITMPGTLAKHYSQLGGRVQLMGKPDPLIYTAAQELTAQHSSSSSNSSQGQHWLAIGDSLEHDCVG